MAISVWQLLTSTCSPVLYLCASVYEYIHIRHTVTPHIMYAWIGLHECVWTCLCVWTHVVLPCWRLQYCCEKACGEGEAWEPKENGRTRCLRPASKLLYPLAQVPCPWRQGFQRWVRLNGLEGERQIDDRRVCVGRKKWLKSEAFLFTSCTIQCWMRAAKDREYFSVWYELYYT